MYPAFLFPPLGIFADEYSPVHCYHRTPWPCGFGMALADRHPKRIAANRAVFILKSARFPSVLRQNALGGCAFLPIFLGFQENFISARPICHHRKSLPNQSVFGG